MKRIFELNSRNGHIDFFNRELKDFNKEFAEDMLVVCEEFEVIYN
ncbi:MULTISPECIES: hypothetical protein [Clostridium]|uniref:Uncharacterized protein n=1 Tax=Clostridium aquiflavi TaxID=3073603 RepID=A0ABU1EKE4_9CLOT|nr:MULTISPECIES: hypothetical protein [unclassified Clostridium]MDR5588638.1 hypothetical protein [Clostridium sp. 5N-1]